MRRQPALFALVALLCACAAMPAVRAAAPVLATPACDNGCADLSLTVSGPDSGHVGEALEYDIVVENEGPADTPDAVVSDTLPDGAQLVSTSTTQGSCDDAPGGVLSCDLGELDYPGAATIALTVLPGKQGSNLDSASVRSAVDDPDTTNNQDSTEGSMSVNVLGATIVKSGPATAGNNTPITYTLTVTLPSCLEVGGECNSTNVTITDALPAGETYVSLVTGGSSGATIVCTSPVVGTNGTIICTWEDVNIGSGQTLTESINAFLFTNASAVVNVASESDDFGSEETVPSNPVITTLGQPTQPTPPPASTPASTPTPPPPTVGYILQSGPQVTIVIKGCGTTSPASPLYISVFQNIPVTVTPCPGSTFIGWTGGPCNGTTDNPCDFSATPGITVTASFSP